MGQPKRGRPDFNSINELIREGELNAGPLQCEFCFRNFPRRKSLKLHRKTHLGEKPYQCTYPGCDRRFTQSSQLKTHIKRHTGEKPYACAVFGCSVRFIHSSRKCPKHPGIKLKPDKKEEIIMPENLSNEEIMWFEEYKENRRRLVTKNQSPIIPKYKIRVPKYVPESTKEQKYTLPGFDLSSENSWSGFSSSSENSNIGHSSPVTDFCDKSSSSFADFCNKPSNMATSRERSSLSTSSCSSGSSSSSGSFFNSLDMNVSSGKRPVPSKDKSINKKARVCLTDTEAATILLSFHFWKNKGYE